MPGEKHVFTYLQLHTTDHINVEYSHEHLRRIVEVFRKSGNKTNVFISYGVAQSILESQDNAELLETLSNAVKEGHGIGMLTTNSNPRIVEAGGNLDWEESYRVTERYANYRQDSITGKFDTDRSGGTKVISEIFGRYPEIITQWLITDVYYHRQRGAIFNLGTHFAKLLDGWVDPPLAWFMGMVMRLVYPMGKNTSNFLSWPPNDAYAREILNDLVKNVPENGPHMISFGTHNVDLYANNPCWTSMGMESPHHVEMRAYSKGNPSSMEEARIPKHYFYTKEQVEQNYERLQLLMRTLRERAESDPDFEVVSVRELVSQIDTELVKKLDRKQLLKVAQFITENSGRGPPEWVPMEGSDVLTLAQAFDSLVEAVSVWHSDGKLPDEVTADGLLLGPTRQPREWQGDTSRAGVDGREVSLEVLANACANVSGELGKGEPPDLPLYVKAGDLELNTAEMLHAAAQGVLKMDGGELGNVALRELSMHPEPCVTAKQPWLSDEEMAGRKLTEQLSRLQFWTVKPVRFV